jgi:predicted HTH domain antitoxin
MSVVLDDSILKQTKLSEDEIKIELAVSLYARGKLTLGQASEFTGLTQLEFQRQLAQRDVPLNYDLTELKRDVETLKKMKWL